MVLSFFSPAVELRWCVGATSKVFPLTLAHFKKRLLRRRELATEARNVGRAYGVAREVLIDIDVVGKRELLRQEEEHELLRIEREHPQKRLRDNFCMVKRQWIVLDRQDRATAKILLTVRAGQAEHQFPVLVEREIEPSMPDGGRLEEKPPSHRRIVSALDVAALTALVDRDKSV